MALAYKCDRCKSLKEGNKHGTITTEDTDGEHVTKRLDLCYECFRECDAYIGMVPPRALPLNPPPLNPDSI